MWMRGGGGSRIGIQASFVKLNKFTQKPIERGERRERERGERERREDVLELETGMKFHNEMKINNATLQADRFNKEHARWPLIYRSDRFSGKARQSFIQKLELLPRFEKKSFFFRPLLDFPGTSSRLLFRSVSKLDFFGKGKKSFSFFVPHLISPPSFFWETATARNSNGGISSSFSVYRK